MCGGGGECYYRYFEQFQLEAAQNVTSRLSMIADFTATWLIFIDLKGDNLVNLATQVDLDLPRGRSTCT